MGVKTINKNKEGEQKNRDNLTTNQKNLPLNLRKPTVGPDN